ALARTWAWLHQQAGGSAEIDFGIAHLAPRLPADPDLEALNAPSVSAPVMLPAHVDALSQTSPVPQPSPEVALFLHGPERASADVQVCWRSDLNLNDVQSEENTKELLTFCPPASAECLPVPFPIPTLVDG
ncbi:MAG: type I-G CRISPR-associated helicase/endonuclease Cas3g, partial [bacterium]